jgi:hypothetical protein
MTTSQREPWACPMCGGPHSYDDPCVVAPPPLKCTCGAKRMPYAWHDDGCLAITEDVR